MTSSACSYCGKHHQEASDIVCDGVFSFFDGRVDELAIDEGISNNDEIKLLRNEILNKNREIEDLRAKVELLENLAKKNNNKIHSLKTRVSQLKKDIPIP